MNDVVIPKLIMQTWKTEELPVKWKPSQSSINKYMSDWDYILMTDEMNRKFIMQHFPDFITHYDNFKYPIQRADAIRYAWLYINGGIYLDCDFELLAPLDELFIEDYDNFLVASSNTPNIITNGFMASKPKEKLWLDMINEMKNHPGIYSIEMHLHVMNTTGPMAFNRVVKRGNYNYKLLPTEKINPYTICDIDYNNPTALMKPLEGSSWVSGIGVFCQYCYCNSNNLFIIIILIILILLLLILMIYYPYFIIN